MTLVTFTEVTGDLLTERSGVGVQLHQQVEPLTTRRHLVTTPAEV